MLQSMGSQSWTRLSDGTELIHKMKNRNLMIPLIYTEKKNVYKKAQQHFMVKEKRITVH